MDPHDAALFDLINLARQRGGLTMEDLRKALPLDSMSVEDISLVLTRLDKAGVDLEIDPDLLLPENKTAPQDTAAVRTSEQTESPKTATKSGRQGTGLPTSASEPIQKNHEARRADYVASAPMLPWIVAFAIVVLAAFAIFAL